MTEKSNKRNATLFYVLIIIELIIVIILSLRNHENISFKNETLGLLNEDWIYVNQSGSSEYVDLPTKLDAGPDNTIVISHVIPDDILPQTAISLVTSHQSIYVYIDNNLIFEKTDYSYGSLIDVPSGNILVIVPLPLGCEGKIISLKIISEYDDYAGRINDVHIGDKSVLLIHRIISMGFNLLLALTTLICGISAILIYIFLKRLLKINQSILYLGWFFILASLWIIMESGLVQIIIDNEAVISALTYLSLMTIPIPILFYILQFDSFKYKKVAHYSSYIFITTAFLNIILQFFNILDFHESLFFTKLEIQLLFIINFIALMVDLLRNRNKELRTFTLSAGILFVMGGIEMFTYNQRAGNNIGVYFLVGFLIFAFILLIGALKNLAKIIKLSESAWHYKYLATKDSLTNCRTRVAYSHDMDALSLDQKVTVFLADMDHMKNINDTLGHHAGDKAIILCSQCLLSVFGDSVYRIGGDEFVCLQYDLDQSSIDNKLEKLETEFKFKSKNSPYTIHMSVGYATFNKSIDKNIYDTVERADTKMYEMKNKSKE